MSPLFSLGYGPSVSTASVTKGIFGLVKTTALVIIITGLMICSGAAIDPVGLDQDRVEPKYLIPVNLHGRKYEEAVEKLLDKRWGNGTMIYDDSAGGKFVVSVWGKDYANYDYDHPLHNFITFINLAPDKGAKVVKAQKEIDVPIDIDFAMTIQRAWATMLIKTRYPQNSYLGADGCTAEFSAWVRGLGGVYGYTWSPESGLTKDFIDLGFALADYCKAPEGEGSNRRKKLMTRLEEVRKKPGAKKKHARREIQKGAGGVASKIL